MFCLFIFHAITINSCVFLSTILFIVYFAHLLNTPFYFLLPFLWINPVFLKCFIFSHIYNFYKTLNLSKNSNNSALTFKQCSVSFFVNILNLVSSPIKRTVLFFVSMLIWSFFRTYKLKETLLR